MLIFHPHPNHPRLSDAKEPVRDNDLYAPSYIRSSLRIWVAVRIEAHLCPRLGKCHRLTRHSADASQDLDGLGLELWDVHRVGLDGESAGLLGAECGVSFLAGGVPDCHAQ